MNMVVFQQKVMYVLNAEGLKRIKSLIVTAVQEWTVSEMTIGELEKYCKYIGREWGNDAPMYMIFEDIDGNKKVDRILDAFYTKDGSLYLRNTLGERMDGE